MNYQWARLYPVLWTSPQCNVPAQTTPLCFGHGLITHSESRASILTNSVKGSDPLAIGQQTDWVVTLVKGVPSYQIWCLLLSRNLEIALLNTPCYMYRGFYNDRAGCIPLPWASVHWLVHACQFEMIRWWHTMPQVNRSLWIQFYWGLLLCNGYQFCSSNVWVLQHHSVHAFDMSAIIGFVYLGL